MRPAGRMHHDLSGRIAGPRPRLEDRSDGTCADRKAGPKRPDAYAADLRRARRRHRRRLVRQRVSTPSAAPLLPPLQPDLPAPDQDDHRAADLRDAGRRDRRRRPLQGRRPHGPARDHLLRGGHDAGAGHRPRRRQRDAARASASTCRWASSPGITATAQTWDQILLHVGARVGHQGDGRRRRAADRRLQHHLRDRARA